MSFTPPPLTSLCWPHPSADLTPLLADGRTADIANHLLREKQCHSNWFPFGFGHHHLIPGNRKPTAAIIRRWLTEFGGAAFSPVASQFDPRFGPDRHDCHPTLFQPHCVLPYSVRPAIAVKNNVGYRAGWNSEQCFIPSKVVGIPVDIDKTDGDKNPARFSAQDVCDYIRTELEEDYSMSVSRSGGGRKWHCVLFAQSADEIQWKDLQYLVQLVSKCVPLADTGMRTLMTLAINHKRRVWEWFDGSNPVIDCDNLLSKRRESVEKRKEARLASNGSAVQAVNWESLLSEVGISHTKQGATDGWTHINCPLCARTNDPDKGFHLGLHDDGGYHCWRNPSEHKGANGLKLLETYVCRGITEAAERHKPL